MNEQDQINQYNTMAAMMGQPKIEQPSASEFAEKFFGDCPSITELEGLPTEGNLCMTVQNQLRAKLGSVNHGLFTPTMGTVMQLSSGKWFDWWKNEGETITIKESE